MTRRGMTLMEVLLAIALVLALSGVIFTFLRDVLATRQRVQDITAQQRVASSLIDTIERQAIFTFVGDDRNGSGIVGDESSLSIMSRGVAVREVADRDALHKAFLDALRTEFRFNPQTHMLQMAQTVPMITTANNVGARERLDHDDVASGIDNDPFDTLPARLYLVRFRYHDGMAWRSSFDSRHADRLPRAIEVAIWFDPWPGADWTGRGADRATGDAGGEDDEPMRLTFDQADVFDERDWAMRADRDFRPDPPPDRLRVIAIPDAEAEESATPAGNSRVAQE